MLNAEERKKLIGFMNEVLVAKQESKTPPSYHLNKDFFNVLSQYLKLSFRKTDSREYQYLKKYRAEIATEIAKQKNYNLMGEFCQVFSSGSKLLQDCPLDFNEISTYASQNIESKQRIALNCWKVGLMISKKEWANLSEDEKENRLNKIKSMPDIFCSSKISIDGTVLNFCSSFIDENGMLALFEDKVGSLTKREILMFLKEYAYRGNMYAVNKEQNAHKEKNLYNWLSNIPASKLKINLNDILINTDIFFASDHLIYFNENLAPEKIKYFNEFIKKTIENQKNKKINYDPFKLDDRQRGMNGEDALLSSAVQMARKVHNFHFAKEIVPLVNDPDLYLSLSFLMHYNSKNASLFGLGNIVQEIAQQCIFKNMPPKEYLREFVKPILKNNNTYMRGFVIPDFENSSAFSALEALHERNLVNSNGNYTLSKNKLKTL